VWHFWFQVASGRLISLGRIWVTSREAGASVRVSFTESDFLRGGKELITADATVGVNAQITKKVNQIGGHKGYFDISTENFQPICSKPLHR
jgi:hypothetical protein